MPPFTIGLSGPSRAGKSTLAAGLCRRLCGDHAEREPRRGKTDKVTRFSGQHGTRVSIICQDSFFFANIDSSEWDCAASLDHNMIHAAIEREIGDANLHCLIFEGFKAFHDERVPKLMDMMLWLDVPKEVACKRRMKSNKRCTEEHFYEQIWSGHMDYCTHSAHKYEEQVLRLCGTEPISKVLEQAIALVKQRDKRLKAAEEAVVAASQLLRTKRSRADYGIPRTALDGGDNSKWLLAFKDHDRDEIVSCQPATTTNSGARELSRSRSPPCQQAISSGNPYRKDIACANPACWFSIHKSPTFGGYCCKKCHWRHATGLKSGKAHEKSCAKKDAPCGAKRAAATPPLQPLEGAGAIKEVCIVTISPYQEVPWTRTVHLVDRANLACANTNCPFFVGESPDSGGYCCKKCHWRHTTNTKTNKKHDATCSKRQARLDTPRASAMPPLNPYADESCAAAKVAGEPFENKLITPEQTEHVAADKSRHFAASITFLDKSIPEVIDGSVSDLNIGQTLRTNLSIQRSNTGA